MNTVKVRMTSQEFVDLTCKLGICGCGNPEDSYKAVHELLLLVRELVKKDPDNFWYKQWNALMENPYALTVLYMLSDREFLEHGTSVYGSWITSEGNRLIAALDLMSEYGYDYDETFNLLSEDQ